MISPEREAEILRLHHAEKWPIGTVAAQLGLHHSTVRRVLAQAGVPAGKQMLRPSIVDPFVPFIVETLAKSDAHAESAAAIFSLVASCRLHGIDPELYLGEVMRVLPDWPKERHLELSPKYWATTRSNLLPAELDSPLCAFTFRLPRSTSHASKALA